MPIPESAAVLKSYFQTGDKPTQAQFADWIDTMFSIVQTATDAAEAAAAAAAAAQKLRVLLVMTSNASMTIYENIGIDSVTVTAGVGTQIFRFNFTNAFPDTKYHVTILYDGEAQTAPLETPVAVFYSKNFAYVEYRCPAHSGRNNILQLTIFDDYA